MQEEKTFEIPTFSEDVFSRHSYSPRIGYVYTRYDLPPFYIKLKVIRTKKGKTTSSVVNGTFLFIQGEEGIKLLMPKLNIVMGDDWNYQEFYVNENYTIFLDNREVQLSNPRRLRHTDFFAFDIDYK